MRKIIIVSIFMFVMLSGRAYACSPTFPSLWPPSITSTISTEHSVGITWSMTLPFVGDITAYRIYLNGSHIHTISPSITSLMFNPAGHGSYAARNLMPDTQYNMAVGVVFAIPVGCGITWNVEMKSSASITTKPKSWNHGAGNSTFTSVQNSSKPHPPAFNINNVHANSANITYNVTGAYSDLNFQQEKYPINKIFFTVGSACNPETFTGYQNSPYYFSGKGYNITAQNGVCAYVVPYKTSYCRYKLNRPYKVINKEINITSNGGSLNLEGLTGDTEYVIYGYIENSNGDISNESAPIFFTTQQGKTITPAACSNGY